MGFKFKNKGKFEIIDHDKVVTFLFFWFRVESY